VVVVTTVVLTEVATVKTSLSLGVDPKVKLAPGGSEAEDPTVKLVLPGGATVATVVACAPKDTPEHA